MSTQATVIGAYDSVRRSRDAQDQRSRSADGEGDNLMKGRTFIPRMSAESRKLLIEAMQKARKKRQERLASKEKAKIDERTRPSLTAAEDETKGLIESASKISEDSIRDFQSRPLSSMLLQQTPITQLEAPTRNTVLRGVLEDIGIVDADWAGDQLFKENAWFSHLSGEPIQDRLTELRDRSKGFENPDPSSAALANMTDDEISAYAQRIEDAIPLEERPAYYDSKRKYRHREIERIDDKLREKKENEVLTADEQDLSDAKSRQGRSLRTLSPEISLANALSQLPGGTIQGAVEEGISPAIKALRSLAMGGKIPQYKKRTIKYRR